MNLAAQVNTDLAKYEKLASSKYAGDLKESAWKAMAANYHETKKVKVGDVDGFDEDVQLRKLRWNIDLRIEPHSFARSDFDETDPYIKEIIETGERIYDKSLSAK